MVFEIKRTEGPMARMAKAAVLVDFVQMSGGEGPAQMFCHLFMSAFLVNKRSLYIHSKNFG